MPEAIGSRANAEEKNRQYAGEDAGWFGADVLQAVIGQSLNKFTPLQLACYASALANKGTRYEATLMSRIPVSLNLSSTLCRPSRTSIRACWISGSLTTAIRSLTLSSKACA